MAGSISTLRVKVEENASHGDFFLHKNWYSCLTLETCQLQPSHIFPFELSLWIKFCWSKKILGPLPPKRGVKSVVPPPLTEPEPPSSDSEEVEEIPMPGEVVMKTFGMLSFGKRVNKTSQKGRF